MSIDGPYTATHDRFSVLLAGLAVIAVAVFLGDYLGYASLVGNWAYIPVNAAFFLLAASLARKHRNTEAAKFAVFFAASAAIWLVAEAVWTIMELVQHEEPYPSIADVFYVGGYIPLFLALTFLILPNWKRVSGDVKIVGAGIATAFVIPMVLLTQSQLHESVAANVLSFAYPFVDVGLMWFVFVLAASFAVKKDALVFILAITFLVIGDVGFGVLSADDAYYTGHPIEIAFLWSYLFFAYSAYIIGKNPDRLIGILKSEISEKKITLPSTLRAGIVACITGVLITVSILTVEYFQFFNLSTNEETVVTSMLYAAGALLVGSFATGMILYRIRASLRRESGEITLHGTTDQISAMEARIARLEAREKKNSKMTIIVAVALLSVLLFYVSESSFVVREFDTSHHLVTVENLEGDKIDIWTIWQVPEGEALKISIINANFLTDEKLRMLKNAIASEEVRFIERTSGGGEGSSGYLSHYVGWAGALKSVQNRTLYPVPTNFEMVESDRTVGDIVIILSKQASSDGTFAFTRTIADEGGNQIVKSYITIFDVGNIGGLDLAAITRHEFGHAMGLGHSTDPDSLMYHRFDTKRSFISECELDAITALYNGKRMQGFVCR